MKVCEVRGRIDKDSNSIDRHLISTTIVLAEDKPTITRSQQELKSFRNLTTPHKFAGLDRIGDKRS
jgi:hypothetical protein